MPGTLQRVVRRDALGLFGRQDTELGGQLLDRGDVSVWCGLRLLWMGFTLTLYCPGGLLEELLGLTVSTFGHRQEAVWRR